jgi:peptidoglycan hydrolase-like protein with peptidoglycan-binding domain
VILPAGLLKPGATGAEVKTLQRALARAGHSPGPVDGDYGPKTEQAVSAAQRSAGITIDGIYGPQTKKALQQALKSG